MMHIGCSCTDHPQTTVAVIDAHEIQAGDAILPATADEIDAFTGTLDEIIIMSCRTPRPVTEVRQRNGRAILNHGRYDGFTNVSPRTPFMVLVTE